MIANRELSMEDYLAISRRRLIVVVIPALLAPLLAFLISFLFTPKYTSYSLLLVKPQVVPTGYVKPIITERVSDRMTTLQQNVLSRGRLQSLVSRLGLTASGKSEDRIIEAIRANVQITEADPNSPPPGSASGSSNSPALRNRAGIEDVTGFYVSFATDNPRDAQQVCAEITSMLLAENLEVRQQAAESTTDFLSRQLEQAKQNLDGLDQKLSEFKKLHLGRLPTDEDNNLKILMGLASQLDANTQALSRAQQDKAFAESVLTQEVAAWKSLQASPNVPTLRQQLLALENQLVELQSRYTEDHPDVVKIENDIAEMKANLKDMSSDPDSEDSTEGLRAKMEPPEILRLREQIHQNEIVMARATHEQKRLQELINSYQDRLSVSPDVEEQYKQLTRDNETAHTIYDNLLTNESAARMQTEMERKQQGEQMKLLDPAILPTSPSFPVRWKFALGGFGAGLCIGLSIAFWLELRDKSIRNEGDVLAALELPMLASVPWLGANENGGDGKGRFRDRFKPLSGEKRSA